jgi:Flp pilus assembly protein TadD
MTSTLRLRVGLLGASLLVIGVTACGTPVTATGLVSQGLQAQLAGDTSTAETTYQQAIKLDPNNAVAHYDLGTVYDRMGDAAQAVSQYTAALVIQPAFTDALFNLADDTTSTDPAGAETLYLRVLTLQPSFAAAWLNLGFIVAAEGKSADARADWAKAVGLDASLAAHVPAASPSATTAAPTPKA